MVLLPYKAQAQSSVTLYGVVDVGITYLSNTGGRAQTSVDSSPSKPSRIGLRGSEDLGNGLSAIFNLEAGFFPSNGRQADPNTFWNRESSIGLSSRTWGTLKFGRMPDLSYIDMGILDGTPLIEGGLQGGYTGLARPNGEPGPPPPVDLHYGGARYNNAVKWVGNFGPFRTGLMYARGGEDGHDRMWGAMVRYASGGFAIGAAYTKDNFTTAVFARQALIVKAQYATGAFTFAANYGIGKDDTSRAQIRPLELVMVYAPDNHWRIGGGFGYAWARSASGKKARIQQPFLGVKYLLSPRTELYVMVARVKSSDPSAVPATFGAAGGATEISSSSTMSAVRTGIVYNF